MISASLPSEQLQGGFEARRYGIDPWLLELGCEWQQSDILGALDGYR
jgi:hypothetical protein